jgi:serine phosphatase RsbU (regulator of sigma subunit)
MRLKGKIALVFVLLVIFPLAIGIFVSSAALSKYLSSQQYAVIRQTAEQLDELIRLEKKDVLAIAEVLSGTRAVREAMKGEDRRRLRLLARIYQRLGRADIIEFRQSTGRVLLRSERHNPDLAGDALPAPPAGGSGTSVDIYPEGAEIVIRATAPVSAGGEPVGSVVIAERLSRKFIERFKEEMGFEVAIIGKDRVLYSTLASLDLQSLPLAEIEATRRQFYGRTRIQDVPYTMAAYPLLRSDGEYQGALLLLQPETTFRAAVARARRAIAFAGLLALLYALGVGYLVARKLQAPIAELLHKMHQVMQGNYDVQVEVRTRDEFRDLADGFNNMLQQIRRSRQHLGVQNRRLRSFARTIKRELEVAGEVQSLLIPKEYADDLVEVRVQYFPMREVGGDYAFFHIHEDGIGYFVIADVSGHGVPAALMMSRVSAEIEDLVRRRVPIDQLVSHMNLFIYQNFSAAGMYLTLFCARVDFRNGLLEYANAAHPSQWLFRSDTGEFVELQVLDLPLGAFEPEVLGDPHVERLSFRAGDLLFLFTDGLIEVADRQGNPLGLGRLRNILESALQNSQEELIQSVVSAVKKYSGGRFEDDALFVAVRFRSGPSATGRQERQEIAAVDNGK